MTETNNMVENNSMIKKFGMQDDDENYTTQENTT
jgi:hypothetical protein